MGKKCIHCNLSINPEYELCYKCIRDPDITIIYSEAIRIYKLTDDDIDYYDNNVKKLFRIKVDTYSYSYIKFFRTEIDDVAWRLVKDLNIDNKMRIAYFKNCETAH